MEDISIIKPQSTFNPELKDPILNKYFNNILFSCLHNLKPFSSQSKLDSVIKQIKTIPNLIFSKADKSNTILILNQCDYNNLVYNHLNDDKTYIKINDDPLTSINICIDEFLNNFSSVLTENETKAIKNLNNQNINRFYILLKIHKCTEINDIIKDSSMKFISSKLPNNMTSRPIVSQTNFILKPLDF